MERDFRRIRVIKDPEKVRELLKIPEEYGIGVVTIGKGGLFHSYADMLLNGRVKVSETMIVELKLTKLEITTKYYEGKATTYVFSLNDEEVGQAVGHKCFATFQKYYKIPKLEDSEVSDAWLDKETGKFSCSAGPTIGYNPIYQKRDLFDCYEYDLNSAYFSIILKQIPDLSHPEKTFRKVNKGEVGFVMTDKLWLVEAGGNAEIIFPLIDTPDGIKRFSEKYYGIKKNAKKGSQKRKDAKDMLNLPIGYCQRWNPFFRAFVIHRCNKVIEDLIDDDTLFWNTDAIYSSRKREDLELGDEIGQWKETNLKRLRYVGNTYQIDDDPPVYRGIPKNWFTNFQKVKGRPFNLIVDPVPNAMNKWAFDLSTLTLKEITYEKEKEV